MIPVSYPILPDFERFSSIARDAWKQGRLTNNGDLVRSLEEKITHFLGLPSLRLTANGTTALQILLRVCSLPERRKIVVTPLSFVATVDAILWCGYQPVFADLLLDSLQMDDAEVLSALNDDDVAAVVTTHLFGIPADDGRIARLCAARGIPLLFDAAHAFGVETSQGSLVAAGAASAISFHATKAFGTVEGGGLVGGHPETVERFERARAFGVKDGVAVDLGTNAKMSELHAAFGLAALETYESARLARQVRWYRYRDLLPGSVMLIDLEAPPITRHNYGYAVVVVESEARLLAVRASLHGNGIDSRRYFFPALSELAFIENAVRTPVASALSRRLLALPLFRELPLEEVERICRLITAAT